MVEVLSKSCIENGIEEEHGDAAYCIIDSDFGEYKNKIIANAEKMANERGIKLLVSAPCFEIWFICHYAVSTKKYHSTREVLEDLKRYIPDYQKNKKGMYERTKDKLKNAIENAETLKKICLKNGYVPHTVEFSPSADIWEIAKKIME